MKQPNKLVHDMQMALVGGDQHWLERLPDLVILFIRDKGWDKSLDRKGNPFQSFKAFVEHPLIEGLETKVGYLENLCEREPEAVEAIRGTYETARPARKKRGKDESGDIIPTLRGTSADHTLARLKRDNPELAEQVVKGELSANAAAIQAGFRHPMIQVRADDLEAALEKLRKHYGVKLIWR